MDGWFAYTKEYKSQGNSIECACLFVRLFVACLLLFSNHVLRGGGGGGGVLCSTFCRTRNGYEIMIISSL